LSDVAHGDERILAEAREHFRVGPSCGPVVAQELRPVGEALEDRVIGLHKGGRDPLRGFDAIVIREQLDGQHSLDRAAFVIAFGLDPLKGQIAAHHQEAAAVVHKITYELQAVGPALGSDRHAVRKQKRVRADVA
jgi:hypothetical protein